ncbi:hypothetical protein P9112_000850 [Eukaryota sp. TZLM1-RC]
MGCPSATQPSPCSDPSTRGRASACEGCPSRGKCGSAPAPSSSTPCSDPNQRGRASACEGCPSRAACQSGQAPTTGPDPDVLAVQERLKNVKNIILVLSGKGGVGKSTVASQLAYYLSESHETGLLDIDITGPSVPTLTGTVGHDVHQSGAGWMPVYPRDKLAVMSIGYLLQDPNDAVIWRGPRKVGLIKSFLKDVSWEDLEYLVIDTPPGTSDEHLSILQFLSGVKISGAIVVTTPQEVAMADVRKELSFCKKTNIPVIGVVSNMDGFVCPSCSECTYIFQSKTSHPLAMAESMDVPFLGKLPLDPQLMQACDTGAPYFEVAPDSNGAKAMMQVVDSIVKRLK